MSQTLLGPAARPAARAAIGALVLHGFTGTPDAVRPLAEALAAAGAEVELPLLPGHGRGPDRLATTCYADWLAGARAALGRLAERAERLVAVGHSMGGTLALELATGGDLAGVVVVNPLVEPPARSVLELLRAALAAGTTTVSFPGSDVCRDDLDYLGATEAPIEALCSLLEAVEPLGERLGAVRAPVLLFSSRVDHVVPVTNGEFLCARLSAPVERVVLDRSYHLAPLDHDGPQIAERTAAFVAGLSEASR